jgi:hypothetical protein
MKATSYLFGVLLLSGASATASAQATAPQSSSTAEALPPVMHFCALNCMTLTLNNGKYVTLNEDGVTLAAVWRVESFSTESVIIHRNDVTGFSAVFKGQISSDGGRLINVTMNDAPAPGTIFTWGNALNSIPGSNAERDHTPTRSLASGTAPSPSGDDAAQVRSMLAAIPSKNYDNLADYLTDAKPGDNFLDVPQEISQCGGGACPQGGGLQGVWAFSGHMGEGQGEDGMTWRLGVFHYGADYVEIRGLTLSGRLIGMWTSYRGVVKGDRIDGVITWHWNDEVSTEVWSATITKPAPKDPEAAMWKSDCAPWSGFPQADPKYPLKAVEHFYDVSDYEEALCWAKTAAIRDDNPKGAEETAVLYARIGSMEKARYWERIAALRGSPLPPDFRIDVAEFHKQKSWYDDWITPAPLTEWSEENYHDQCVKTRDNPHPGGGLDCYAHKPSGELYSHFHYGEWSTDLYEQRCVTASDQLKMIWSVECARHLPSGKLR